MISFKPSTEPSACYYITAGRDKGLIRSIEETNVVYFYSQVTYSMKLFMQQYSCNRIDEKYMYLSGTF